MAKKGKKGKGKKGGGGGGKEVEIVDQVTEVEKELFQIQITDLTRKVERLKERCLELEISNEECQKNYATLDEDRADIIAYLKRTTQQKQEEIEELEERIDALIKSRDAEVEMYQEKIAKMDHDFKIMHEHLTSDIKLLSGKLNALEEFRIQKDDLMKKFKQQEIDMEEQEERHKRTLYEIERKFIIGKDKLVKEMESRLVKLSTDFRDATEIRIAATTHHAIRENIAISNELDLMLEMQNKLSEENRRMKEQDKRLRLEVELHQEERDITLAKNRHQIKLLNKLAREHEAMKTRVGRLEYAAKRAKELELQLEQVSEMLEKSLHHCRVLNQKLHAAQYEQNQLQLKIAEDHLKYDRLVIVIETAARAINDALEVTDTPDVDEVVVKETHDGLLTRLLELMDTTTMEYMPLVEPSMESIISYQKGDLGLIPKESEPLLGPVPTTKSLTAVRTTSSKRLGDEDSLERTSSEEGMGRTSSVRMAEDAAKRTSSVRIAEDAAKRTSSVRLAEDGMNRTSSVRLAEDAMNRTSSVRLAEDGMKRTSSVRMAEDGMKQTSSVRMAEDGMKQTSSVRMAEDAMKRTSSARLAEDSAKRTSSVRLAEDAMKQTSSARMLEDGIKRKSSMKMADDGGAVKPKASVRISEDVIARKSSVKIAEGTKDVDHPSEEEGHKDQEPPSP